MQLIVDMYLYQCASISRQFLCVECSLSYSVLSVLMSLCSETQCRPTAIEIKDIKQGRTRNYRGSVKNPPVSW